MANGGPYRPGRPPQWWLEKVYADQAMQLDQRNYQVNHLDPFIVPPDVYIAGRRYSGTTGKLIKDA